jgi:hypothetical protein
MTMITTRVSLITEKQSLIATGSFTERRHLGPYVTTLVAIVDFPGRSVSIGTTMVVSIRTS